MCIGLISVVKLSDNQFSMVIILIGENLLKISKFTNIETAIVSQESELLIIISAYVVRDYSVYPLSNTPSNHCILCSQPREPMTEIITPKYNVSHEIIAAVSIVAEAHKGKRPR